jgi:carbon monoxide dehydrogenase subunit G
VLLEVARVVDVRAAPPAAWALIRDVPSLAACIPNVSDVRALDAAGRYAATVSDRLGPFKLSVKVEIEVQEAEPGRQIVARMTGTDRQGQARVRGDLVGTVEPSNDGSRVTLNMKLEVLGKLATLGAAPMRRRADELFGTLGQRLQAELDATGASADLGGYLS